MTKNLNLNSVQKDKNVNKELNQHFLWLEATPNIKQIEQERAKKRDKILHLENSSIRFPPTNFPKKISF